MLEDIRPGICEEEVVVLVEVVMPKADERVREGLERVREGLDGGTGRALVGGRKTSLGVEGLGGTKWRSIFTAG